MIRRDWSNLLTNVIFPWNIQEVVLARVGFSVAFVVWLAWIGGKHFWKPALKIRLDMLILFLEKGNGNQ
jgi:hypothetical protein